VTVYPLKCRIRADAGTTRVDVYDDIGGGGWFSDGVSAADFANQLAGINGALEVHINSAGGDVFDGITIGNSIRGHTGPVTTVVDGLAASIASVIAQAGRERVVAPGSMLMIHDAFGGCMGNAEEMTQMAGTLDKVSGNLASIYADRCGGTPESWRAAMKDETWYTADEAVTAGLADKVSGEQAELPAGLDLAAFTAIPGRIAARLRTMPKAAADGTGGDGGPPCKTCGGTGRLKHPGTGANGMKCPGCDGTGTYTPGTDGDSGGDGSMEDAADPDEGTEECHTCDGTGKIREGHVKCPDCDGTGRVPEGSQDDGKPSGRAQGRPRNTAGDEDLGDGWVRGADGTVRFDPDGDGDDDSTPEGDTDHDYFDPDGKQIKPLPRCPVARDAAEEQLWAFYRLAVRDADGKADNSPWDGSKAMANGTASDDPAAFFAGICAGEKAGDKSTQAAWALPYKYHPDDPPNAAGVKNALARLPQTQDLTNEAEAKKTLQAAMKQVNPDWEPEDSTGKTVSASRLEQMRSALPALKGARA
jgi:ATP-dependent protease ClpP protease subunit